MTLQELKEAVDTAIENTIEYGDKADNIEVSLQIQTLDTPEDICTSEISAHYDCDACTSGFVLLGLIGYSE
jgi:hypothetical protein